MNINILEISKLKWTGMGEFNSDDHDTYYCGQNPLEEMVHPGSQPLLVTGCAVWSEDPGGWGRWGLGVKATWEQQPRLHGQPPSMGSVGEVRQQQSGRVKGGAIQAQPARRTQEKGSV